MADEPTNLDEDPYVTFERWYGDAQAEAMSLATATPTGVPSVRTVLYKGRSSRRDKCFACHAAVLKYKRFHPL